MGQMASGLAHELNQPLGAIANFATAARTLLETGDIAPQALPGILSDITAEATRAGEIIRRMRGFVKKQRPQAHSVDSHELVREAVALLSFDLRQAGVRLDLDLSAPAVRVFADSIQIQQVLVNLIQNAIAAMDDLPTDEKQITIRASMAPNGQFQVDVIDRGRGIAPENQDRIFDAFFTTRPEGLGMGLCSAERLSRNMADNSRSGPTPVAASLSNSRLKSIHYFLGFTYRHISVQFFDTPLDEWPCD